MVANFMANNIMADKICGIFEKYSHIFVLHLFGRRRYVRHKSVT